MMLLYYLEREREREFTEEELLLLRKMRGEEEERITDMTTERFFEFHTLDRSKAKKKRLTLSSLFGKAI